MQTYDAIVIGSGISGGWAAKELCEQGLKTLVLERGRDVKHIKDYPTAMKHPWEFKHGGKMPKAFTDANPITSKAWLFDESSAHFFIEDQDHPYVQEKPFDWIRGYQVGGKSLTWGRASQRWSDNEFKSPAQHGYGIEWPIGYADIASWYAHVERFVGVCGAKDGVESMPDGEYLPPFPFNCVEEFMYKTLVEHFPDRKMIQGRWAHLSEPQEIHLQQGRGKCQCRNLCVRGCPFGGYFSSVASTLPWAEKTGNLTIRPFSVVHSILYHEKTGKASGVRVIDTNSKETLEFEAKIIFVNASALNTNLILLNSTSRRFPNGLGNDNGLLGKYICFQNYRPATFGTIDGFEDVYVTGRNPTGPIIPNYKNFKKKDADFDGGYMTFAGAFRTPRRVVADDAPQLGADFKHQLSEAGDWNVYMYMQGETVPKESNRVYLSPDKVDQWGIPQLVTDVAYDENDEKMIADFHRETKVMLEKTGCKNIQLIDSKQNPGLDIHEMGGVRMGKDPQTSLLNAHNQLHYCKNVFVTDGACMTSTGTQSPSILYMALTARAATYAVDQLKNGLL
ncbi:GMC family oxidoreductase [Haliscomenobacter sp.]|uniref:GMC family oxidoreductase n=1 Tax=Haliscomenobacter sp. TaxID=2717303 RepID=UPI0033651F96